MAIEYIIKSSIRNYVNSDGQPHSAFNLKYRMGREMDELIGICKGVISDGAVVQREAEFLNRWLVCNEEIARTWPASDLSARLERILMDGKLDEEEKQDLILFIEKATGMSARDEYDSNKSTLLAFDDPPPDITFAGNFFCFTGKMMAGTRAWCISEVEARGGFFKNSPVTCHYLVIGAIGSRDWLHSSHGRKIESAVEKRKTTGNFPKIISEKHWSEALRNHDATR